MTRFRQHSFRLTALLATLFLLVAQVGAIQHDWAHVLDLQGAHAATDEHFGRDHDSGHQHGPICGDSDSIHDDGDAAALCNLCAHFAAVVHVPAAQSGPAFVPHSATFARALLPTTLLSTRNTVPYAARAPPASLN